LDEIVMNEKKLNRIGTLLKIIGTLIAFVFASGKLLASPYRFATELKASGQLLVMFSFSFGWVLIGSIFRSLPAKVKHPISLEM